MRIRNGRRNGLLLILLALLVYAGWLRWADRLNHLLPFDLSAVVITVCELTGIIGALLVIASVLPPPRPKFPPTGAIPVIGARRKRRAAQQHKAGTRFSSLPPFGLFCSLFLPWLVLLMVFINPYFVKRAGRGLTVRSIKDISQIQPFPGYPPLILRIGLADRYPNHPHYFITAEETSPAKLHDVLKDKLRYRPDKVLFIQADPNVEYQSVISAVDAAKGAGAAVVLVTSAERRSTP